MDKLRVKQIEHSIFSKFQIPGSKSYTNRALVMAALANGQSTLINPLKSDDTKFMIESLRNLGIEINEYDDKFVVRGTGGKFEIKSNKLFSGIAGTTSRFLSALSCIIGNEVEIHGEGKLLERPIGQLVDGIKQLGVEVRYLGKVGSIPLRINGTKISNYEISMKGDVSSQYFTALLLIAPLLEKGLTINVEGEQVSKSYIDMTINGMKEFGVLVENDNYKKYSVRPNQEYKSREYRVEGDWSSASYFCALGALHKGQVEIENINNNSTQGDKEFPMLLEKMGARVEYNQNSIKISGGNNLVGIQCDMEQMPDTAMTLAVVAVFADGITHIKGLSTLKVKETDRLEAMKNEFAKCGIKSEITSDSIKIYGNPDLFEKQISERIVKIETYHDHRIAMAFGILGTVVSGIEILNPSVVNKSFPKFWEYLDIIKNEQNEN